jgi:hypothetical protein
VVEKKWSGGEGVNMVKVLFIELYEN